MADRRAHFQVIAALNHAARTFDSFDAADWRAMAVECAKHADAMTCMDCGLDVGRNATMQRLATKMTGPDHRRVGEHWSCGAKGLR